MGTITISALLMRILRPRKVRSPPTLAPSHSVSAGLKAHCCPLGHMPRCWCFMAEINTWFLADGDLQSPGDLIIQISIFPR